MEIESDDDQSDEDDYDFEDDEDEDIDDSCPPGCDTDIYEKVVPILLAARTTCWPMNECCFCPATCLPMCSLVAVQDDVSQ